uniref:Fibronectin type-III domain-containing protein n=1 Tax=Candidatus Kentrum eta TaxID=2126337 RepID=A0A450V2I3_9GAMM|nr:MAG: hypothetical protein BECKH772A_GA0070896_101511 [Candidatus Kentron sp. H]VFJ99210.1 MAG: hypothetical protein BECKH772B_GA0070898_101531 [Candidatus Kentron sp. H]VFK03862.1 MAG: hypothetical protein BECKH772C_GA0070978_101481 [Candidatus Kentron sp. H]
MAVFHSFYKVVFRARAPVGDESGDWNNEGTALATETTLTGQPQDKELEYGVVAMNKAGEGDDEQYGDRYVVDSERPPRRSRANRDCHSTHAFDHSIGRSTR